MRLDLPGLTCLQEDAWAAGLLVGEGEWETELRDEDSEGEAEEGGSDADGEGPGLPPSAEE